MKRKSNALIPKTGLLDEQPTKLVDSDQSVPILITPNRKRKLSVAERGVEELEKRGYDNIETEEYSSGDTTEVSLK